MVAQCTKSAAYFGDMYQGWTQLGGAMTILTPDDHFSTHLMFVTPNLTANQQFAKLSVIVLSASMSNVHLNGMKIEVCVDYI